LTSRSLTPKPHSGAQQHGGGEEGTKAGSFARPGSLRDETSLAWGWRCADSGHLGPVSQDTHHRAGLKEVCGSTEWPGESVRRFAPVCPFCRGQALRRAVGSNRPYRGQHPSRTHEN
jgi:hypothetical protein